jgi:dihydroorotate dehydrogenase
MADWRLAAYRAVRPLLFLADAESIHHLTLRLLGSPVGRALAPFASGASPDRTSPVELMGLQFRNRVGLGAGFDKDGVAIRGWAALGFGFVELGTVTPRPQAGNPRPRLFRLPADEALINRMGFNNAGADALARRIADARPHLPEGFVIGVNIGRNRDTPDERAAEDYAAAAGAVANIADYLVINVSSPNTPGLLGLQAPDRLTELLSVVREAAPQPPLLVKLSSDLDDAVRITLADAVAAAGAAGVIVSNTTTDRSALRSSESLETGGLSGRPLLERTVAAVEEVGGRRLAVVASGGIGSAEDARRLLDAGSDLVQLWTGMIYAGPGLIGEIVFASFEA